MTPCLFGTEDELALVVASGGEVRPGPAELAPAIVRDLAERYRHLPSPPPERRIFLENGACVYADIGGHPEIASAECCDPMDLAAQALALRRMLAESAESVGRVYGVPVRLVANNVDYAFGGARTYGHHLNVLVSGVSIEHAARQLAPLLAAMPVVAGAGRVSFAPGTSGFELSQRAGHIHCLLGKHTTQSRAMVTLKDEPLCKKGHRMHLLSLDTTMSPWQLMLVPAIIALSLKAVEAGEDVAGPIALAEPVQVLRTVSCDPSLKAQLPLASGGTVTALGVLDRYHAAATRVAGGSGCPSWAGEMTKLWGEVIRNLRTDPFSEFGRIDWVTKLLLLTQELQRMRLSWQTFSRWTCALASVRRLKATWPELDPLEMSRSARKRAEIPRSALGILERHFAQNGLSWAEFPRIWQAANRLCHACLNYHTLGSGQKQAASDRFSPFVSEQAIHAARTTPPKGTRAEIRGRAIRDAPAGAMAWWTFVTVGNRRLVMSGAFGEDASWQQCNDSTSKELASGRDDCTSDW